MLNIVPPRNCYFSGIIYAVLNSHMLDLYHVPSRDALHQTDAILVGSRTSDVKTT